MKCDNVDNGCSWVGTVATLDNHVTASCGFSIVDCQYESIGCEVKMMRKLIKDHEENDDKVHLHLALSTISSHDQLLHKLERRKSWTFVMTDFNKKKKTKELFDSESFYTGSIGYKLCIIVHAAGYDIGAGTHLSVYVPILKGPYDDKLHWPFLGRVTVELLNQLEDMDHHSRTIHFDAEHDAGVGDNWGWGEFLFQSKLSHDPENNTQYLMDDMLYFRVTVEVDSRKPWLS